MTSIRSMTASDRSAVRAIYEAHREHRGRRHLDHEDRDLPEIAPSLALHARCGFRVNGGRERIGRLGGVWRDTLLLERWSPTIG